MVWVACSNPIAPTQHATMPINPEEERNDDEEEEKDEGDGYEL